MKGLAAYMECENGVAADIFCNNKIVYQYYLMRKDEGYVFGLSSNCFSVRDMQGITTVADIDTVIYARDSACFIQSIKIEDGVIASFIDSSAIEWTIGKAD